MSGDRILLTGGSGVLGTALRGLLPELYAPPSTELDLLDHQRVADRIRAYRPDVVIHAAAFTDVAGAEQERSKCWNVNVAGTHAVVAAMRDARARLVHISTDYVFSGDLSGDDAGAGSGYREEDPPGPARNYYALTKLVAEEVARTLPGTLVLRTSFRPNAWPYPVAFTDVFTSQDYVDVIAPDIALAVRRLGDIPYSTLHIATERKSAFELARRRRPDVRPGSKREARVELPDDITLDVSRWRALKARLVGGGTEPAR